MKENHNDRSFPWPYVGCLVHDTTYEMNGLVVEWLKSTGTGSNLWRILYDDGKLGTAFEKELKVLT